MNTTEVTHLTVRDVVVERSAQDAKWGPQQTHPDGTGGGHFEARAENAKRSCQRAATDGNVTWRHILWEEVAEAFAESDLASLRTELIQVAAVAVSWVEDLDRRGYPTDACSCVQCTCA